MKSRCVKILILVATALLIFAAASYQWGSPEAVKNLSKWRPLANAISRNIQQATENGSDTEESVSHETRTKVAGTHDIVQPGTQGVDIVEVKYPPVRLQFVNQISKQYWSPSNQLRNKLIPPNIHMIWCRQDRWFEFKHYLGVLSGIRALQPDKITLHMQYPPVIDKMYYNLWLDDLKHDHTFFIAKQMESKSAAQYCNGDVNNRMLVIMSLLSSEGGIFMSENAWLLKIEPLQRRIDLQMGLDKVDFEGYVMLRRDIWQTGMSYEQLLNNRSLNTAISSCARVHHIYQGSGLTDKADCLIVSGPRYNSFWPMHIWELDDPFGRLARRVFYGREEILHPQPNYDELVPNIAHMVWIGGGKMDLVFYLSVLSLLYVAEVDTVYIHGDKEPGGGYWPTVKSNVALRDRVIFVSRSAPTSVFGGEIQPYYRALMSDIIRVDLMIKYGGIYTDTDAIWVRPLSRADRGYDAVATFDWVDWSWPYPDSVNFGISYGKKNAPFWQIFRDSMRQLHNEHHGFTGVMMPYKLLERYPNLLRIDTHLAVICYYSKCHPIYANDYHNMSKDHTNMGYLKNWKDDVHAFHWTHPNPPEYTNITTLRAATGLFADIGRYVLEKAGLW